MSEYIFCLGNANEDISVTLQHDFACSTSRSPKDGIRGFGNVLTAHSYTVVVSLLTKVVQGRKK